MRVSGLALLAAAALLSEICGAQIGSSPSLAGNDECLGDNVVAACTESALRAAIERGGTIRICCDGEIVLSRTIEVTNSVTLDAQNRRVTITGDGRVRLFAVSPGVTLAMTNVVLANGLHTGAAGTNAPSGQPQNGFPGEGGAIYNAGGTVQLVGCVLTNNRAIGGAGATRDFASRGRGGVGRGGALANVGGTILLQSVVCVSNSVVGGSGGFDPGDPGGAVFPPAQGGDGLGGVLWSSGGVVTITDSGFSNNSSAGGRQWAASRGGAIYHENASLTLVNTILSGNQALGRSAGNTERPGSAYGGAIYTTSGATVLDQTTLRNNTAVGGDAFRHSGVGEALGGAVYSAGTLTVRNSTFSSNEARAGGGATTGEGDGEGGALYVAGSAILAESAFDRNLARGGYASDTSGLTWTASDGFGGAILNGGDLRLTNCTLTLNLARGGDASFSSRGFFGVGAGGGIYNRTGQVACVNVTIASNSVSRGVRFFEKGPSEAESGAALGANIANGTNSAGSFVLRNTIVAYGFNGTNAWTNVWGSVTDSGHNLSSDASANFNSGSSLNSTDPRLGALADYGGPTLTMALAPNSPAIDTGGTSGAPAIDQRGLPRPSGTDVDIGAFEFQIPGPRLFIVRTPLEEVRVGFEARADTSYRLQSSLALTNWTDLESFGPYASPTNISRPYSTLADPDRFFRVVHP